MSRHCQHPSGSAPDMATMHMLSPVIGVYGYAYALSYAYVLFWHYCVAIMLSLGISLCSIRYYCSSFMPCPGHSTLSLAVSVLGAAQGHCVSYYFITMKFPSMPFLFHSGSMYAAQGFPAFSPSIFIIL